MKSSATPRANAPTRPRITWASSPATRTCGSAEERQVVVSLVAERGLARGPGARLRPHRRTCESHPYGKAVVGFFITGNDDGQFVVHYHDHSEPTQRAFPRLAGEEVWGPPPVERCLENQLHQLHPDQCSAQKWPSTFTHYAPGPQPDFREFKERNPWEVRERLAAHSNARSGGRWSSWPTPLPITTPSRMPALGRRGNAADYAHRRNGFPIAFNPVCAADVATSSSSPNWTCAPIPARRGHAARLSANGPACRKPPGNGGAFIGKWRASPWRTITPTGTTTWPILQRPEVHAQIGAARKVRSAPPD